MTSQGIGQNLKEMAELPKVSKVSADHLVDFNQPVYNVFSAALMERTRLDCPASRWPGKARS